MLKIHQGHQHHQIYRGTKNIFVVEGGEDECFFSEDEVNNLHPKIANSTGRVVCVGFGIKESVGQRDSKFLEFTSFTKSSCGDPKEILDMVMRYVEKDKPFDGNSQIIIRNINFFAFASAMVLTGITKQRNGAYRDFKEVLESSKNPDDFEIVNFVNAIALEDELDFSIRSMCIHYGPKQDAPNSRIREALEWYANIKKFEVERKKLGTIEKNTKAYDEIEKVVKDLGEWLYQKNKDKNSVLVTA